jgi:hypothetical protein
MTTPFNSFTAKAASLAAEASEEEFLRRLTEAKVDRPIDVGLSLMTPEQATIELGFTKGTGAIRIQYPDIDGKLTSFSRYRFLGAFNGNKYHQIPGTGVHAYMANNSSRTFLERLNDLHEPLVITEGEFKALRCSAEGYLTVGLGGVDSITKSFKGDKRLIAPLSQIPRGKVVYICYDYDGADTATPGEPKAEVAKAEKRLAAMLALRGCEVRLMRIGDTASRMKVGLDDFLNAGGNMQLKMVTARRFRPTKSDGENYLLAEYATVNGEVIHIGTHNILPASKFMTQEKNCKNPFDDDGDSKVLPTQRYFSSLDRTTLEGIAFDPTSRCAITADNYLNSWHGFKTDPSPGDVSPWLEFVDLFFSLDSATGQHFEETMALVLQKPWIKQERLCILKSGMTGIGKSFYFETIAAIINGSPKGRPNGPFDHALVSSARDLDGDFNSTLAGKKFVVFNEIGEKGEKHTNLLKDMATGYSLTINEKHSKARSTVNYLQFCITTNERFTHLMDADSRRELVYSIPKLDPLANKLREFFVSNTALREWVNTPEARSALLNYYLNYDLKGYDGTQAAPSNSSKDEMAAVLQTDIDIYIDEELHDVDFIIPKLECEKMYQRYPKLNCSESFIRAKLHEAGYIKGAYDRTRGQLKFGDELAKGNKEMVRPVVLCTLERQMVPTAQYPAIAEALHARYWGTRKL